MQGSQQAAQSTRHDTLSATSKRYVHSQTALTWCAGLIFLSAMATSIADEGHEAGKGSGVILGTALLTTTVATVLVGICIIIVGACWALSTSLTGSARLCQARISQTRRQAGLSRFEQAGASWPRWCSACPRLSWPAAWAISTDGKPHSVLTTKQAEPGCAGRYHLATLVQYVPLPVVAGYLGYVGYFCVAASAALACNVEVSPAVATCDVYSIALIFMLQHAVAPQLEFARASAHAGQLTSAAQLLLAWHAQSSCRAYGLCCAFT